MLTYRSYAKLNLSLAVTGLMPNGYHRLDMVMQQISLHDMVRVGKADTLRVHCGGVCDEKKNTAYRIARAFFDYTGVSGGAQVEIVKNIPAQAGLGGGSSNAACTLQALDRLYRTRLSEDEKIGIAVKIGADVPFFLRGGCMRAQGIGEILSPLRNNCHMDYLLVKPDGGVDTMLAYEVSDSLGHVPVDTQAVADALQDGDTRAYFRAADNALYGAARQLNPQVAQAVADCRESGAQFAMMTGSGSCVFAVYENKKLLEAAAGVLKNKYAFVRRATDING